MYPNTPKRKLKGEKEGRTDWLNSVTKDEHQLLQPSGLVNRRHLRPSPPRSGDPRATLALWSPWGPGSRAASALSIRPSPRAQLLRRQLTGRGGGSRGRGGWSPAGSGPGPGQELWPLGEAGRGAQATRPWGPLRPPAPLWSYLDRHPRGRGESSPLTRAPPLSPRPWERGEGALGIGGGGQGHGEHQLWGPGAGAPWFGAGRVGPTAPRVILDPGGWCEPCLA